MQFLKTPGNIHCHKKILHNTLLNNMWLHATLREGPGGGGTRGDPASLPNSPERVRIATGAVEFIQRMGAISGLARGSWPCFLALKEWQQREPASQPSRGLLWRSRRFVLRYANAPFI